MICRPHVFFITALLKSKAATGRGTPNCSSGWAQWILETPFDTEISRLEVPRRSHTVRTL
jgi:hypothetical protein